MKLPWNGMWKCGLELPLGIGPSAAALPWPPDPQVEERLGERTCRRGPHLGAPPRQRTPCLSTARESNPALLLGRQGPQPLGQRYESRIEMERAPRVELGPSDWQSGMQPQTPCARRGQGRNRTDSYRGCNPAPSHLATWPCRGDGANRTRATVVGLGLANRPVTAPARLRRNRSCPREDSNLQSLRS